MQARLMHPDEQPLVIDMMRRSGDAVHEETLATRVVFVLPDGLRLAGFASVTLDPPDAARDSCRSAHIAACSVEPDLTSGRAALVDAIERWARAHGARELTAKVPVDSDVELAEYRGAGFGRHRRLQELRKDLVRQTSAREPVQIELYSAPREQLRSLFMLAEDSSVESDSYMHLGRLLVAVTGGEIVGHLQLVETDDPTHAEIKNMAVHESLQGQGIGAELVQKPQYGCWLTSR